MSAGSGGLPGGTRAVLLDALGTLLELEPPAPRLVAELARRGFEVGLAEAEQAIGAEIAYYRRHLDEGRDQPSLAALRRRCAQEMGRRLPGVTLEEPSLTEALLASLRFRAYPDAVPALLSLRSHGLRLVVASNWDVSLPGVLEGAGLAGLLDGVVTSAGVGARKPDAPIFRRALALAGAEPAAAVHVGDGLVEDVGGARAAGIEPILIARGIAGPPAPGVRTIATLGELV